MKLGDLHYAWCTKLGKPVPEVIIGFTAWDSWKYAVTLNHRGTHVVEVGYLREETKRMKMLYGV